MPARRTIIVALHGIGFAKPGELVPALEQLRSGPDDVTIDANWNDIAAAGYDGDMDSDQLVRLCWALNEAGNLRPPSPGGKRRGLLAECALDLADFYFTLSLWVATPLLVAAFVSTQLGRAGGLAWADIGAAAGWYVAGYAALATLGLVLLAVALAAGRSPLRIAQAAHLVLLAIRPPWILSNIYMTVLRISFNDIFGRLPIHIVFWGSVAALILISQKTVAIGVVLLIVSLYVFCPLIVAAVFAPALKLAKDVLLYIADPAYRDSIQSSLGAKVEAARGDASRVHLIVVGHSLGSVIGADFLVSRPFAPCYEAFTLITFGSPIRRLFTRILPGHILPAGVPAIVEALAARGRFSWYNYYRRLDMVGAKLGLPRGPGFREAPSRILTDPLRSHLAYWREPALFEFVAACRAKEAPGRVADPLG